MDLCSTDFSLWVSNSAWRTIPKQARFEGAAFAVYRPGSFVEPHRLKSVLPAAKNNAPEG
jgi:hypothetical protein